MKAKTLGKIIRNGIAIALGALIIGMAAPARSVQGQQGTLTANEIYDRLAQVTFRLYTLQGQSACTGFLAKPAYVDPEWNNVVTGDVVLTAGHCVLHGIYSRQISEFLTEVGWPVQGGESPVTDVGVILTHDFRCDMLCVRSASAVAAADVFAPIATVNPVPGETVYMYGFGQGGPEAAPVAEYNWGEVLGPDPYSSQAFDVRWHRLPRPGTSGSPVMNSRGEIVGVNIAHYLDDPYVGVETGIEAINETLSPLPEWTSPYSVSRHGSRGR